MVWPHPGRLSGGSQTTSSGLGGGSTALDRPLWGWPNHPRPNEVANHHLWGGSATPTYIYIFDFFF